MADQNQTNASESSVNTSNSPKSPRTRKGQQTVKPKRRQKKRKLPPTDHLHEDVCRVLRNCDEGTELKALTYALQPESDFMECIFEKIFNDIKTVLSQRFQSFEIHPFGSSVCGMAFKSKCRKCLYSLKIVSYIFGYKIINFASSATVLSYTPCNIIYSTFFC